jgi:hypothetical protein
MNSSTLVKISGLAFLALASPLILSSMKCDASAAQAQERQQSQSQQASPPPPPPPQNSQPSSQQMSPAEQLASKHRRVWTNDDLIALRSPMDIYLMQKEAQEAADAEAAAEKAAIAEQIKEAGLAMTLPSTAEETQRLIETKQDQIKDFQDGMDRLNKDLPDAPPDRKPEIQKQIETLKGYLQKAQLEVSLLRDHLQDLAKTLPSETPPAPPAPSSPSPPPPAENPQ